MNKKLAQYILRAGMLFVALFAVISAVQIASASSSNQQTISLKTGWNIVSTPRIVDSHIFSAPETLSNFSIYALDASHTSGWATMADLGQTEFTPLYGYFINNKTGSTQTLTFNYKASTTPNERLFSRSFNGAGWYSLGIANPTYAKTQGSTTVDTNNPDKILSSLLGATSNYDSVVDYTNASFGTNPDSVALIDPWKLVIRSSSVANTTEINSLNDFRETKGYAIYIKATSTLTGFQNDITVVPPSPVPEPVAASLDASSPSGNIIAGQNGALLAVFRFTNNSGTTSKLNALTLQRTGISSDAALTGLSLYDGTDNLVVSGTSTTAGKIGFTNGAAGFVPLTVPNAGTALVKVRANIGTSTAGQTIGFMLTNAQVTAGTATGTPVSSANQTIIAAPATSTPAGTLALAKYSAYANQTVVVPQTTYKLGEYRLTTGATDNFTLIDFGTTFTGSANTLSKLSDIYVVVGTTTSQVATSTNGYILWFTNKALAQNSTTNIAIYGTLSSGITQGETLTTSLIAEAISQNINDAVNTPTVQGQTITMSAGSIIAAVDASTPVSSILVGNTIPKIASFKFTAQGDSFTIADLAMGDLAIGIAAQQNQANPISQFVLKDGANTIATVPLSGEFATATGLSISIPANTSKVIDVYASLGNIGSGSAPSGKNIRVFLRNFDAINSGGTHTRIFPNTEIFGNSFFGYKTKPTITNVALPATVLNDGTQTIYKFTVTADAGGTVAWRRVRFSIASTSVFVSAFNLYDDANQSTVLTNTTCGPTGSTVTCTSSADQEVIGSKTYVLKATISGSAIGSSISTSIQNSGIGYAVPASTAVVQNTFASFMWSDESIVPHSATTADWNNDYLVKNIPTDSQTMTK